MEENQNIIAQQVQTQEQKTRRPKHKFTPEEDELIRQFVGQHGVNQWDAVAKSLDQRTPRQCRDRWKHYLSPLVSHNEFTIDEDKNLIQLCMTIGPQWSALTKFFPGRTDVNLKNRWNKLQRNYKKLNGESFDEKLAAIKKNDLLMMKQPKLYKEQIKAQENPSQKSNFNAIKDSNYNNQKQENGFNSTQDNHYNQAQENEYNSTQDNHYNQAQENGYNSTQDNHYNQAQGNSYGNEQEGCYDEQNKSNFYGTQENNYECNQEGNYNVQHENNFDQVNNQ